MAEMTWVAGQEQMMADQVEKLVLAEAVPGGAALEGLRVLICQQ